MTVKRVLHAISIDGADVTSSFDPHLISLTITDSEGGKSDTLEVTLDDTDGRIRLPRVRAEITAILGWDGGESISFNGFTDEPKCRLARGQGMTLSITAHSADFRGKGKEQQRRHKDGADFKTVAGEWGEKAGLKIKVADELGSIKRDYWFIDESFFAWGLRMAEDLGATFKVSGKQAVFVPRGSAVTSGGQQLAVVRATRPGNIITADLSPNVSRRQYSKFRARWYDPKAARWKENVVEVDGASESGGLDPTFTRRSKGGNEDDARRLAKSDKDEGDRDKGGGTLKLDGEPGARAQATCLVSGVRDGIDGEYRITDATHSYSRSSGYTTDITVKQPSGKAGVDDRKAQK